MRLFRRFEYTFELSWKLLRRYLESENNIIEPSIKNAKIYVFGSRSRGDQKKYLDLDLVIEPQAKISEKLLLELKEQFAQSKLPFKVDLVDSEKLDSDFKLLIKDELKHF